MRSGAATGESPEFISSHPSDASRIAAIRKLIPEARHYYTGAKIK
jgi:Zn-dependent protease with chaperone function